jgi:hypothetical protein
MQRFHVVTMDAKEDDLTPDDIERIEAGLVRLRAFVNDPVELVARAQALLEGTAERLI